MEYLLFLQELRLNAGTVVNDTILFFSAFMGETRGIAVMALVYWCLCKSAGAFILLNFSSAYMANQTLKNIFRISRPFLLDSRLQPYVPASGYSFPSGHTMLGTAVYASAAIWQRKRKWFVALCVILTLFTAFGRNWIGVHTPQDVIFGMIVSCAVVALNAYALRRVEDQPRIQGFLLLAGIAWVLTLLVLIPGSGKVCGIYLGIMAGLLIERRWIGFETEGTLLRRVLRFVGGMALVLAVNKGVLPLLFAPLNATLSALLMNFFTFLVLTAGWPALIKRFHI